MEQSPPSEADSHSAS